ncbi:MAG: ABC transporter substrate-binding protein [bacterium]|nr:ABC transporter substrate-binding protein [bacterium]
MAARRIASLVPSLTHTVCALGARDRLVARTIYCVEPRSELGGVPACGGTKNPDLPAIFSLEPDLALACTEENKPEHLAALRDAGVMVHEVMPRSLDDVARLLADYGELLGVDARPLLDDLAAARRELTAPPRRRAAALIWKEPWMAAGGENYLDGMMAELNLENVFRDRAGYPETDLGELADLAPEVVLLPDEPWCFRDADARLLAEAGILGQALLSDGKDLCWYGAWAPGGLRRLAALLAD